MVTWTGILMALILCVGLLGVGIAFLLAILWIVTDPKRIIRHEISRGDDHD